MKLHPPRALTVIAASLSASLVAPLAHAQVPPAVPDAGSLLQEIERSRRPVAPPRTPELKPAEPQMLEALPGERVFVREFRFTGNTVIASDVLAGVTAAYTGRALGFAELREAADAVARHYREAGWVVRVVLPKQDVTEGIITLRIVEAVFGGSRRDEDAPLRLQMSLVLERIDAQQRKGEKLQAAHIERALLIADDLPGIKVGASLRAGAQESETILALKLDDEPIVAGSLNLTNTGARSTGEDMLSADISLASPFGIGEQFIASAQHTRGSDYLRLGASLPLGPDGWRIGASVSRLDYRLISSELKSLDGEGSSDTYGLDASYPILRSRSRNLYLGLNLDQKRFENWILGDLQSDYTSIAASVSLSADLADGLGGGGVNRASFALVSGQVDLGRLQPGENPDRQGGFSKLRYGLSRQQNLTEDLTLYAQLSGQEARKALDSSESFSLGGSSGVRAYPSSEGTGETGQLVNVELNWKLNDSLGLGGFYDWGHVVNREGDLDYSLKGFGLALIWKAPGKLMFKAVWAHRDGNNPNPTAEGKDQDGTRDINRWWLTASLPF